MKVAVYTITQDKFELARKSFKSLHKCAGIQFDHYVWDQASRPDMQAWLDEQKTRGRIKWLRLSSRNVGQNIAANFMLDAIEFGEYDWVLRWDPDALTWSRRFLKRLIATAEKVIEYGEVPILSPEITKLKEPPQAIKVVEHEDFGKIEVVQMLGGICRLHPASIFDGWRFNQFMPMGLGEAAEMAEYAAQLEQNGCPCKMLRWYGAQVEHAYGEDGQIEKYPESFGFQRRLNRHIGYGL